MEIEITEDNLDVANAVSKLPEIILSLSSNVEPDQEEDKAQSAEADRVDRTETKIYNRLDAPTFSHSLTDKDVRALLTATAIRIARNVNETDSATIYAIKEMPGVNGTELVEHEINVSAMIINDINPSDSYAMMIHGALLNNVWSTLARFFRKNDSLKLMWHIDTRQGSLFDRNGNECRQDVVTLRITRYDGRGRGAVRIFDFHVTASY